MIGETISGFLLERKIATASTGTVYCAKDTKLEVDKAIKILHPQIAENEVARKRFKMALQAWAKLDYPTFAPIYTAIDNGNTLGFVMNYVEGRPLIELIKKQGKLGISQAVDYFLQIAKVLSFAHQHQILHRKMAVGNILVSKDETLKLVGLGALRDTNEEKVTPTHLCIGKPQYMAPEQFAGNYSPQTDQYTLGVILYQMITGKLPFASRNLRTLYQMHMQKKPESLKTHTPEMEIELENIILKMLAKRPENRYESMDELIEAVLMATDRLDVSGDISVQSLLYRGRHALERRKLENAVYFFNKILSIYGKETHYYEEAHKKRQEAAAMRKEEEDLRIARDLYIESLGYFDDEDIDTTREYIIKILRVMQEHPDSSRIRGVKMDIAREMPEILEEATEWLEQKLQESKLLTAKGEQLAEEGHYEEALDLFEQALEHDPKNRTAQVDKTNTLKKRKIALVARCYCNAQAAYKQRDYNQAISLFDKVLQLDQKHNKAQKYKDMAAREKEKEEKHKKEVEEYYQEGLALYEKWQYSKALEKFEKVLQLAPDHSEVEHFLDITRLRLDEDTKIEEIGLFYQNGVTFYETRKWREAIACFNRVLKEIPTHKKALDYNRLAQDAMASEELWTRTFAEAVELFNQSKYTEAMEKLDYLQRFDENNQEVLRYQRLCRELMSSP